EVVLDGAFAPSGDHQDVGEPGRDGLLDHVLDRRFVDDRQHLLGGGLGGGQESGAESGRRHDRLPHGLHLSHRTPSTMSSPPARRGGKRTATPHVRTYERKRIVLALPCAAWRGR